MTGKTKAVISVEIAAVAGACPEFIEGLLRNDRLLHGHYSRFTRKMHPQAVNEVNASCTSIEGPPFSRDSAFALAVRVGVAAPPPSPTSLWPRHLANGVLGLIMYHPIDKYLKRTNR